MKLAQRIVLEYYRKKFKALSLFSAQKAAQSAFRLFCTPRSGKKHKERTPVFDKGDTLGFTIEGVRITGFRWRPVHNNNGHTMLICHGFDSCSYRFTEYVTGFLDAGFTVMAFDAPAHGVSHGKTITVLRYANMIAHIIKTYGPVHGVMAHSLGGLATVLALEKIHDHHCKRLVMVSPSTETVFAVDQYLEMLKITGPVKSAFHQVIENIGGNPASWYSVARAIENLPVKTLWIHDRKDKITPFAHMEHLTIKNLPHIEFEITEGLGHSPYRYPEIKQRILGFVAGMVM